MTQFLVVDSTQPIIRMGLWQDNSSYIHITGKTPYDASTLFFDYVDQLCSKDTQLTAVIGLTGPGSFTSLRAGLAALQGMALAKNIPGIGISSFEAYAISTPTPEPTLFLIESQREDHYAQIFHHGTPQGNAFLATLNQAKEMKLNMIGNAIEPTQLPVLDKVCEFVATRADKVNRPLLPIYGIAAHTS